MTAIHERRDTEDEIITARRLPVLVDVSPCDDGGHVAKGWVACPLYGRVHLETCSVCRYSHGVRLMAEGSAPEVLCGWLPTERTA